MSSKKATDWIRGHDLKPKADIQELMMRSKKKVLCFFKCSWIPLIFEVMYKLKEFQGATQQSYKLKLTLNVPELMIRAKKGLKSF